MIEAGTSEDTGSEALTVESAAERIAGLLPEFGDSEDGETQEAEASEADEDEADEAEDDSEQSDDEDETDDSERPELADDTPITVQVDGADVEVTLHELKRGFLREADYTRKTMALADERTQLAQARESYGTGLQRLNDYLAAAAEDNEDLSELRQTDPAEYAARIADRQVRQQQLAQLAAEQKRVEAERAGDDAKAEAERLQKEHAKLLEVLPHWADEAKARADSGTIAKYGTKLGLTPQELGSITDHRLVKALLDAAKYDAIQTKKPVVQAKVAAAKTAAPGAKPAKSADTELTRSKKRLAQTGRVQDAAAAIELLLG